MKITWIGQSGYLLRSGETTILIDPYLSDAVERVANRPRMVPAVLEPEKINVDAVFCTHDHLDHLDPDAIAQMPDTNTFYTTCGGAIHLQSLGKSRVYPMKEGERIQLGSFLITAVFADHTVEAVGLVVEAEGKKLYFSGDTLFNEKLFEMADYGLDAAFLCINGKLGNMNLEEALVVAEKINAKVNIPNHYGMFASNTADPYAFTSRLSNGFVMEYGTEYDFNEVKKDVKA